MALAQHRNRPSGAAYIMGFRRGTTLKNGPCPAVTARRRDRRTAADRPPAAPPAGPRRSGPGPASLPASPCSQTAALAASKAGMPCASRPAMKPASTSPEPAVASQGGAFSVIEARPSGAATTVSEPFSSTTAPDVCGRRRARDHILMHFQPLVRSDLNKRANSPSCGVSTVGADASRLDRGKQRLGRLGEARQRVGVEHHRPLARERRQHHVPHRRARPRRPGPSTTVLSRASASRPTSSAAPSTGRTMTARLAAALTASASRGLAMVTRPAPARSAPRAASRAAPVCD